MALPGPTGQPSAPIATASRQPAEDPSLTSDGGPLFRTRVERIRLLGGEGLLQRT